MTKTIEFTINININIKIPVLEKLIDYLASGMSAIGGPMLAPYKAKKIAETKQIETEAEIKQLELIKDEKKFLESIFNKIEQGFYEQGIVHKNIQHEKRLKNIRSIVYGAANNFQNKNITDHQIDDDWTARFFNCAQDISSENMQQIWSKILSGEIETPGSTSLWTLDILKNITKNDAKMFEKICNLVIDNFIFEEINKTQTELYNDLIHLEHCRLVTTFFNQSCNINLINGEIVLKYGNIALKISALDKNNPPLLNIPISMKLSKFGEELAYFVKNEFQREYLKLFATFLKKENFELFYSKEIEILPNNKYTVKTDSFKSICDLI